jgi:hypothetical protein
MLIEIVYRFLDKKRSQALGSLAKVVVENKGC